MRSLKQEENYICVKGCIEISTSLKELVNMYECYKVTCVTPSTTKRGDIVYHILLDDSILVKYVYPDEKWRSSGKRNRSCSIKLHEFWKRNNDSLINLIGKYIAASLIDTDFGKQFHIVLSTDIISDFKKLLDNANGRAFKADTPIYKFLRKTNYTINGDDSITLRKEYNGYNVNANNLCYPNTNKLNTLTFDNIDKIWEHFYCGKKIDTTITLKSETTEWYSRNEYSICISYERYHDRSETKTDIHRGEYAILTIGDDLKDEHILYLAENHG